MQRSKIFASLDAAVADIPDGSTVGFAGFGGVGTPWFLIGALARQGAFKGERVLFLHTGGSPSLSAFAGVLRDPAYNP